MALARLGPRASFQTASSLASENEYQVDFISLGLERPTSPSSGTALSTHADTQVCNVLLLDEEDVRVRVNLRDPEIKPMLVTRSTETQTECLASAATKTEATQTEGWSLPEEEEALPPPMPEDSTYQEAVEEVAGCAAASAEDEVGFMKEEGTREMAFEGCEGGSGEGDGVVDTAEEVAPEQGPSEDAVVQTSLATHMEEAMLVHDATAQEALATHVEDTAQATEGVVQEALATHAEEGRPDVERRPSSQLTLSDAPHTHSEEPAEDMAEAVEAHNQEIPPQAETEDEHMEAWRLRVQLMMLQEAATSCIPAKMTPRELVRTLGMAMSDRSPFTQASPKDFTYVDSSRDSLMAEGLMTPPSPPAPSSARSPSESSARPLRRSVLFEERTDVPKRVHPVPPLDFSRVHMGDVDVDLDYDEGADSTWMTHGRSISPTASSHLSKSTSDGKLLSRPSLFTDAAPRRQSSPEEKYRKFVGKIRAKHLLPPRQSPFAKPQVLAPIPYKSADSFTMRMAKKGAPKRLPTPFMEQLHSHFHHHFHFRNNLPPISHSVDFESGACYADSQ